MAEVNLPLGGGAKAQDFVRTERGQEESIGTSLKRWAQADQSRMVYGVTHTTQEHILSIDKSKLPGKSYEEIVDGHLVALNIDTGATNLTDFAGISPAGYEGHFLLIGKAFLRVAGIETLSPQTYRISLVDGNGTYTIIELPFTKGSVNLVGSTQTRNGVSKADADAFVAGTKKFADIQSVSTAVDTPTVNNAPTITAKTDTSITATNNISDADGPIQALTYMLYAADGTTLISSKTTNSWGPADGVTANTPYKVRTSAMALN